MNTRQIFITLVLAIAISLGSVWIYHQTIQSRLDELSRSLLYEQPISRFTSLPAISSGGNLDFVAAAESSVHGVVHVMTKSMQDQTYYSPLYDFFFGDGYQNRQTPVTSSGSGVIISEDGYIVTNNHVIEKAEEVYITLNDKRNFKAELIASDPTTDIALLKIKENGLPFLNMGNSDHIRVGEWVLAVGNPFNLNSTVTAGIISAKARNINILSKQFAIESFIQTDAAVNPGNSGGALVNTNGDLIGINTAIASRTGSFIGYSFAVPVNIVKKIVSDMIEFGEVQRAYLGVNIQDIDDKKAKELGMDNIKGVYIAGVSEQGAAKDAGIQEGDVILFLAQKPVNSTAELQEQLSKYRPGDEVGVTIERGKSIKNFQLTLKNVRGNTEIIQTREGEIFGANLSKLENAELSKLRLSKGGVKITNIKEGKFKEAGIISGFIITSINKQRVTGVDEVIMLLNNASGGVFIEGIYPNGRVAYYAFGID